MHWTSELPMISEQTKQNLSSHINISPNIFHQLISVICILFTWHIYQLFFNCEAEAQTRDQLRCFQCQLCYILDHYFNKYALTNLFQTSLNYYVQVYKILKNRMNEDHQAIMAKIDQIIQQLAGKLNISKPKQPEKALFSYKCFNIIMTQLEQNWEDIPQPSSNQKNKWKTLIKVMENSVLEQNIMKQNGDITIIEIFKVYNVLASLAQNISQNSEGSPLKSKERAKQQMSKSAKIKNQQTRLQDQIIETVINAMTKTYKNKNPKTTALMRDNSGKQLVGKAKRNLDYAIKIYEQEQRLRKRKKPQNDGKKKVNVADRAYEKMLQMKHKKLEQEMQNKELGYYLRLREKKIAYVRHIHGLIQKLERQRQIQLHKQQVETHKQLMKEQKEKLQNIDNMFENNMKKLKEDYKANKKAEDLKHVDEIKFYRQIEKDLKEKEKRETKKLKNEWDQQIGKIDLIDDDEERMKKKLIEIYRKNRV